MKQWLRESQSGYSLVELLIVLALVGLVLSLGFSVYALGAKMYSRGSDKATLQQEERYLMEFLPRELRFAYGVELYSSLEEIPALTEGHTVLYSDSQGIWQRQGLADPRLILPADQVTYDIAFGYEEASGTLVLGYRVGLAKSGLPKDYKEVPVRLLNAQLAEDEYVDAWAKVIMYSREP